MEIVVRAAVLFLFLWLVTRGVGKRELAQLSAFELVLLVSMGDLVQQGVTQEDYSITGAVLAIGTFALLSVSLSYASWRFPGSRRVLEGRPTVVVRDGEPQEEVLRYERLPVTELMEAARKQGIRDLAEVDLAVLENDGTLSFFRRSTSDAAASPVEQPTG
ncbi:MAG: DUF421 domain-containing protein [Kineosporiaceae bacterium]